MSDLEPIKGSSRTGDFVLQSQKVAKDEGFRNVSRRWFDQTIGYEKALEMMAEERATVESLEISLERMIPSVTNDGFCLDCNGRLLYLDGYALGQLGTALGIGRQYLLQLLPNRRPGDADALAYAIRHALARGAKPNRRFSLRVQDGNRLRAVLSPNSEWIRNDWYLRVIRLAVPGGRLSHWRGDCFTLYSNVLVPDTIRRESDSDYGAMISLSNCEIGKRPIKQRPSLFRAICMNGCIWGKTAGKALTVVRRGALDLNDLQKKIVENITEQIPLAIKRVDSLLATRSLQTSISMKALIAQVCRGLRLKKKLASSVLRAWHVEKAAAPELSHSLFAVVNSVTRAGQEYDNKTWVQFDELGGQLAAYDRDAWDDLVDRAGKLNTKEVERAFERWSLNNAQTTSV